MDDEYMRVLREFLAENWSRWEDHASSMGEDPQEIYEALGGEPE